MTNLRKPKPYTLEKPKPYTLEKPEPYTLEPPHPLSAPTPGGGDPAPEARQSLRVSGRRAFEDFKGLGFGILGILRIRDLERFQRELNDLRWP